MAKKNGKKCRQETQVIEIITKTAPNLSNVAKVASSEKNQNTVAQGGDCVNTLLHHVMI